MYKNYVFDLYGTLVDIRTDEEKAEVWEKLRLFYGYYGALYGAEEMKRAYKSLVNEELDRSLTGKSRADKDWAGKGLVDAGEMDRSRANKKLMSKGQPHYSHEAYPEIRIEKVFREMFAAKGIQAEDALVLHAGQFFRALATEYLRLYDGVPEMLARLREQGKKVYLLSNAQRIFTEYELHMLGIKPYFDGILISSDHGVRKPDRRFFEILLKKYHLNPKECVMIGNDKATDIAGAAGVGMDTYYIHSNISPDCDMEIDATYVQMGMDIEKVCRTLGISN